MLRLVTRCWVVFALFVVSTVGCGGNETPDSPPPDQVTGAAGNNAAANSPANNPPKQPTPRTDLKFLLDGLAKDWEQTKVVWDEAGATGRGPFKSGLDIKQVRIAHDDDFLYLMLHTSPSVSERYQKHPQSGELCELYLDVDNDPKTGCKDVDGFDYGKIDGYEMKAWIPLGVFSGPSGLGPFVSYDLTAAKEGAFPLDGVVASHSSQQDQALIAHGDDGVELAIPIKAMGAKPGATIRLLLKESVDPFAKERYSEGSYQLAKE